MRSRMFLVLALVMVPSVASAQAWVNAKGELSLSLRSDYQKSEGVWHGSELVTGLPVDALNTALGVEYVPVEKLALGLGFNTNGVRYSGPSMISSNPTVILVHGSQDDGSYHWNLTDLDFEARYQVYDGAIAFTPVLKVRAPLSDYEAKGYAAAGTHLREAGLGFVLGKYGLGLDALVLQLGYTFTFVQKEDAGGEATKQFRTNRSDVDLSLSYLATDKLTVSGGAAFRLTHDGFDLADYPMLPPGDPLFEFHDSVLKVRYLAPSANVSYQLTSSWSVLARFAAVVWGENTSNPFLFGVGIGWSNNLAD